MRFLFEAGMTFIYPSKIQLHSIIHIHVIEYRIVYTHVRQNKSHNNPHIIVVVIGDDI